MIPMIREEDFLVKIVDMNGNLKIIGAWGLLFIRAHIELGGEVDKWNLDPAGAEGVEPPTSVLETLVLPLN